MEATRKIFRTHEYERSQFRRRRRRSANARNGHMHLPTGAKYKQRE